MKPHRIRWSVSAILFVLAVVTGATFLQKRETEDDLRVIEEILDSIAHYYVDEIDREELYKAAIDGLIEGLGDSNSRFVTASEWQNESIRTTGKYGGVGLEVIDRDDYITIVAPIPGTPAARAGLRSEDRIVEVDGVSVEGWQTDQAVELLRGDPGDPVSVGVRRFGVESILTFEVIREIIRVPSVAFATLLDGNVGYIPLSNFSRNATAGLSVAIDSLAAEGMTSLVLDLRRNPGGLLDEGVGVTDLFLDPEQLIVEVRSRSEGSDFFRAGHKQNFPELPVVVLIEAGSASASEIVAGALQDHDRALIIGGASFGKGSVQALIRLSGGNVLRLTTGGWYTPSGRSIQRPNEEQDHSHEIAATLSGGLTERPQLDEKPRFQSAAGRELVGGGGIVPDLWVLPDTLTASEFEAVEAIMHSGGNFFAALRNWVLRYVQENPGLEPDFVITEADLLSFYEVMSERNLGVELQVIHRASRYLEYLLGNEVALQLWGDQGEFERKMVNDLQLQRALTLLRQADDMEELFELAGTPLIGQGGSQSG